VTQGFAPVSVEGRVRPWAHLSLVLVSILAGDVRGQTTAPGPCVTIPGGVLVHRTIRQSSPPDPERPTERDDTVGFGASARLDLDGDGTMDWAVPEPAAGDCVSDMHLALYLSRGSCGHHLGVVIGRPDASASGRRRHGLADLETTVEETVQDDPRVPAVRRTHHRTYRFDGTRYREVRHTTDDAVCHHCALERCTTEPG
jgi:hypothetical protein